MVYHRPLNVVLYAIQQVLVVYPSKYNSLCGLTPDSHSIPPTHLLPLDNHS